MTIDSVRLLNATPSPLSPRRRGPDSPSEQPGESLPSDRFTRNNKGKPYYDAPSDTQARTSYYGDLASENLAPKEFYQKLSKLVQTTHKHELDYKPSQHLYPVVDVRPDGTLKSIYAEGGGASLSEVIADDERRQSEFDRLQEEIKQKCASEGRDPAAELENLQREFHLNCEHVVPQSWFDKKSPMRGDLHHLFACDVQCNSLRGNSLYYDFPAEPNDGCGISNQEHTRFEPDAGKGAVARATLYFLLRYPGQIGDSGREYSAGDIKTLLEWHRQDPPGEFELHRNAEIEKKQGNRNPLVDFPEWADRIDFTEGLGRVGRARREPVVLGADEYYLSCPL